MNPQTTRSESARHPGGDRPVGVGPADAAATQSGRVQHELRAMILAGELPSGSRIGELAMVERLRASRTPVRMALVRLEAEGLVESLPAGGYAVKGFTEQDIHDAIETRGTLEGLAARLAAERGVSGGGLARARAALEEIDRLLEPETFDEQGFATYVEHNARFHAQLQTMADSPVLARQLERIEQLPFASASAFVLVQATGAGARDMLRIAQHQHWMVLEAIAAREGTRAEALMREHARIAHRNLQLAMRSRRSMQLVPGGRLLRDASGPRRSGG